ncbi:DUF6152 family protein [Gammaproteobacteria bacterium]|nr:DUF6152 family protein [Gammaproteobacteria bacterium]
MGGLFVMASSSQAHHSVAGQFDMSNPVEWTGVISDMDWINPHSYIYLDVTEADGSSTVWRLETLPTAMFRKAGLTREMVMGAGQQVTISGLTARDGSKNLGYIIRITYEDGHFYQLSGDPRR